MKPRLTLALVSLLGLPSILLAESTLVLKNGRRITVENYRIEGNTIKIYGLGGEFGIPKSEVQSILKPGETESRGVLVPGSSSITPQETRQEPGTVETEPQSPNANSEEGTSENSPEKILSPEEKQAEEKARQEKEYQKKVGELTEKLKATQQRYSLSSGGSGSSDPSLLSDEEAIRARAADLNARLKDAQNNPDGPPDRGGIDLTTSSPFTGLPPAKIELRPGGVPPRVDPPTVGYSEKEKELSALRGQINQLSNERKRLIEEMKQKNFNTGSLFFE